MTLRSLHPSISMKAMARDEEDTTAQRPLLQESDSTPDGITLPYQAGKIPFLGKRRRRRSDLNDHRDEKGPFARKLRSRTLVLCAVGVLLVLGFIQLITLCLNLVHHLLPNGVDKLVKEWGQPGHVGAGLAHWPTDFTRDILPIPCHSHNDYWRNVPVFSAIQAGCTGIEADIWAFGDDLYVGHSITSLTRNRTLENLYIKPLLDILDKMNVPPQIVEDSHPSLHGIFDTEPSQSMVFMIDFKTYGPTTWPAMYSALEPLRQKGYLTHVKNGTIVHRPLIVVGTGNTPFDHVTSSEHNPHHDVFFDAPLDLMYLGADNETSAPAARDLRPRSLEEPRDTSSIHTEDEFDNPTDPDAYTPLNSYYASTSFSKAIGHLFRGEINETQLELIRGQIRGAQRRGLKARFWETPFWPIGLRNHVWDELVKEGVDYLNVDDLKGATQRDWSDWRGWWSRGMKVHQVNDDGW